MGIQDMRTLKNFGDHMTNKIEERLRLYGKFPPAVKYLAVSRSGYIILKAAFKRHAEYGRSSTYFTYFWDRIY